MSGAVRATDFPSATAFTWFGIAGPALSPEVVHAVGTQATREHLVFSLQQGLYRWFYCEGAATDPRQKPSSSAILRDPLYLARLAASNAGRGYWEPGWHVVSVADHEVVLQRGELRLWASPHDCLPPAATPIAPGARVRLRRPAGSGAVSPGYYTAASDEVFADDDSRHLVRTYWNLTSEGAVRFMQIATSLLNRHGLPFVVKALSDLAQASRCDSVVLYLRSRDYAAASELIEQMHAQVAEHLDVPIPALTKRLADGVGLAEDPNGEGSFGVHRCRLLAEGMVTAQENGARRFRDRLNRVAESLARSGITLDEPYLRPGSTDVYEPLPIKRRRLASGASTTPSPEAPLATAARIGLQLCEQAHWHGDRCTWIAPHVSVTHSGHTVSFKSLGPDVYSGTSGMALFLAELHCATRHVVLRRTALGAIRHALSHAGDIPPASQLGPYTGSLGVALIAARVGGLIGEDDVVDAARRIAYALLRDPPAESEFDLISGKAGAIVALTLLRTVCEGAALVEFAVRLGDDLLASAAKSTAGDSWPALAFPSRRHLTGYSHGTAGVGRALLELFRITGEAKYAQGAQRAFGYERHWFNRRAGNWPDFREDSPGAAGDARPGNAVFQAYWCHGAAGIALSRLRAYEILGDRSCLAEARLALEATRRFTRAGLESEAWNYTLCHGLTGNAEILEYGHAVGALSDRRSMLWLDVASAGVERYVKRNRPWPCGVAGAEALSLMAGVAGIGYFYLRLHDTAVPSILCLREISAASGRWAPSTRPCSAKTCSTPSAAGDP